VDIMAGSEPTAKPSPAELLRGIQARFRELGLFGSTLTLTHNGEKYLATCDDRVFAVYRLVGQGHVSPGRPGWPVCLVTAEAVADETSPPHLADDEFASGLGLEEWLELIEAAYTSR
jgi:hypothetical protein